MKKRLQFMALFILPFFLLLGCGDDSKSEKSTSPTTTTAIDALASESGVLKANEWIHRKVSVSSKAQELRFELSVSKGDVEMLVKYSQQPNEQMYWDNSEDCYARATPNNPGYCISMDAPTQGVWYVSLWAYADSTFTLKTTVVESVDTQEPFSLTQTKNEIGFETNGGKVISRQYSLTLPSTLQDYNNVFIEIPIDATLVDTSTDDHYIIEYYNEDSNEWVSIPALSYLDEEKNILLAELPIDFIQTFISESSTVGRYFTTRQTTTNKIELRAKRIVGWMPNWFKVEFDNSPFVIYYHNILGKDQPMSDANWQGTGNSYTDKEGKKIPNYIGDLHTALELSYRNLLTLTDGNSNNIFNEVNKVVVYVLKMGAAGQAQLGGKMEINIKMDDYNEMLRTVAHEMVHILQGQYYSAWGLFTGRQNRWFIEGTAQYFGQLVINLSGEEKRDYYLGEDYSDYLSVPIASNSSASYYSVGHFLDWLSTNYSTTLVQDTLKNSWASDLNALSSTLKSLGISGGIEEVYRKYVEFVMKEPNADTQINEKIKLRMSQFPGNTFNFPIPKFSVDRTFIQFQANVESLASRYVEISNTPGERSVKQSSLVVIEAKKPLNTLDIMSFDFVGSHKSDYLNKESIDANHNYAQKPFVIEDFGENKTLNQFEQMFVNTSGNAVDIEMNYYILIAPKTKEVQDGAILWDTTSIGNIPIDYIKGYNVYAGSRQLNSAIIPFSRNSQSFSHNTIKKDASDLIVQIVDKHGNEWPKIDAKDVTLHITPDEIPDAKTEQRYEFELISTNIPKDTSHVYFEWDFGDRQNHSKARGPSIAVSADGKAEYAISYIYKANEFFMGIPKSTLRVTLKDAISDAELANAEVELSFYAVSILNSSTTYMLPGDESYDTTIEFEASASPNEKYTYRWNFGDGSATRIDNPATGANSKVSNDYKGLKDGDTLTVTVELFNEANTKVAQDSINLKFEKEQSVAEIPPGKYWGIYNESYKTGGQWGINEPFYQVCVVHNSPFSIEINNEGYVCDKDNDVITLVDDNKAYISIRCDNTWLDLGWWEYSGYIDLTLRSFINGTWKVEGAPYEECGGDILPYP